jgi:hypothetical protein
MRSSDLSSLRSCNDGVVSEPYEELDPRILAQAVVALQVWARRQRRRRRPFLELIDGTKLAPQDLLYQPPPKVPGLEQPKSPSTFGAFIYRRLRKRRRAWPHVLNLVAITYYHGDEDIELLLEQLRTGERREGPAPGLAT